MCSDYKELNKRTIKNQYPLHRIEDLFDQIRETTILQDRCSVRVHEIKIKEEYVSKTAFRTKYDYYEFVVMSFSLTNTPTVFIELMNRISKECLNTFVIVFINDILVYSNMDQENK